MGAQAYAPVCSVKFDKMKPISYTIPYRGIPLTSMGEGGELMKKNAFLRVTFFLKLFCLALLALAWSLLAFSLSRDREREVAQVAAVALVEDEIHTPASVATMAGALE